MSNGRPDAGARLEKRRRDFGLIERALVTGASEFVRAIPIARGGRVLDVGCGTGKASIAAAKAGGDVTGVDERERFLSRARAWAKNEQLLIRFQKIEGARLPFSDSTFDVTMSFLWLPASSDPAAMITQMRRVTRRGGLLALATWQPDGFMAAMLRCAYRYNGDPALARALDWKRDETLQRALVPVAAEIDGGHMEAELVFPLPPDIVAECYLAHHPALVHAMAGLDADQSAHLVDEFKEELQRANRGGGGETRVADRYRYRVARLS